MNRTSHFWNLVSGAVCLSLLILIIQPSSRSFGDSLSNALGTAVVDPGAVPNGAENRNRLVGEMAFPPAVEGEGTIVVGATLSRKQLQQLEPVPALISRQYHSPGGQCYFRFLEGRVVTIHSRTNRVLDVEKPKLLIEL